MSRVVSAYRRLGDESETNSDLEQYYTDIDHPEDDAFGGPERRRQIEKKLLRKLDLRVCFLVLVHVMNYVTSFGFFILLLETYLGQDGQEQRGVSVLRTTAPLPAAILMFCIGLQD